MLGAFVTTRLADPRRTTRACSTAVTDGARCSPRSPDGAPPVIVLSDDRPPIRSARAARPGACRRPGPQRPPVGRGGRGGVERIAARRARRDRPAHRVPSSLRRLRRDAGRDRRADGSGPIRRSSGSASTPATRPTAAAHRSICWRATARASGTCTSRTAIRRGRARTARSSGTIRPRSGTDCSASWARAASTFPRCSASSAATGYDGWIVVEQDVLPAMGSPLASATRNRQYLQSIGL